MLVHAQLTRGPGIDPRGLTYAVIDLETTGLHPGQGSRVCEVGVVRMRGDGVVLDEYSTLVDPQLRITNDEYHGITNVEVKGAPTFEGIVGDLLAILSDAIVVSHNLDYEGKFLAAEFGRLGITWSGIPGICTLITSRVQLDRYGYRLDNVANLVTGEWPAAYHSALGDARTLAHTFAKLINEPPQPLAYAGRAPLTLPAYPRRGHIAPRATGLRKGTEGWLATLTARLPHMAQPPAPNPQGLADYRAMLGHALADGKVVGEEATQLAVLAARAGLTQTTAQWVHEQFLTHARERAEADGVVTSAELKELQRAAKALAASHLIQDLEEAAAADRARKNGPLRGWRLLPVGSGKSVTDVMDFAVIHGATAAVNVTKTVRLVIADGAGDDDPRIAKARAAGIDVVSPEQAQTVLDNEIATVNEGLFATSGGEAVASQLAAERSADTRPQHPEWHEYWRPRELTPAEYKAQFIDRHNDWDDRASRTITFTVEQPKKSGCAAAAVIALVVVAGIVEVARHVIGAMA